VKVLEPPLDVLSRDARSYPAHLLREGDTGLCLFAAAFLGINDAVHMARMEMSVTCVDRDAFALGRMREAYGERWAWYVDDSWSFAEDARARGETWDVVSVDTYTGDATDRSLETIGLWASLARRVVTMTVPHHSLFLREPVPGWTGSRYERSNIADWMVLTRD